MENQSTTSSSMQFLLLEQVQFLQVNDDSLLQWELVDIVDEEEEAEEQREDDGVDLWDFSPKDALIEGIHHRILHLDVPAEDQPHHYDHNDVDVGDADGYHDDEEDDNDDDDDDDGYGLDDELVPWDVSNKFGRQRMRKLGKRVFSRMQNSKKSPYLFVRPGCVRGKHGLGLKHNY